MADVFVGLGRESVETAGGVVIGVRGDEIAGMFDSPRRAVEAAIGLQDRVAAELPLPIGVGLDVPQWLRKLRDEVDRVKEAATIPPKPAEPVRLTFAELKRQLDEWEEPLTEPV